MNKLTPAKRAAVLSCLVDGVSIRATSRVTGVAKGTILRLLASAGTVCAEYQDAILRNLPCRRIQADEIWSFVYGKDRNIPFEVRQSSPFMIGSVWTWTAIDADTKLMVSWYVGERSAGAAAEFARDLASRLTRRIQLTTDGYRFYVNAVEEAFGPDIDYAMLTKLYGSSGNGKSAEIRYSPGRITGTDVERIMGEPDEAHISTSYVERQNLTMRMSMRRFTRLTNGFSKKFENHCHAISLHMFWYNFIRVHQTLHETPAMASGVTDHLWSMADLVGLIESRESLATGVWSSGVT
ncbi:MAG TPA: IS1 family transposase [Thermoanaerobaculia bacterium]|jgi:IS1 family transposase|nr:IS1 family transposase [Thermoanaerobaculia bacterium]